MNGKQAAERLGCSEKSISRYVSTERPEEKRLHATRLADGQLEITDEALEDFKARTQPQPIQRATGADETGQDSRTADSAALVPVRSVPVRQQQNGLTLETLAVAVVAIGQHLEAQTDTTGQDRPNVSLAEKMSLTIQEAHDLSGVPVADIRAGIKNGELKAKKLGRGYKIARPALQTFVDSIFEASND